MRWLPVLALLGATACAPAMSQSVRFYPPHEYRTWWREMEQCSGKRGRMGDWQFRVVPYQELYEIYHRDADGSLHRYYILARTDYATRTITFGAAHILEAQVVRHEMLHALGVHEHDYRIFVTRCGVETDESILWQEEPTHLPPQLQQLLSSGGGMADTPS